jgi:uncharacterized membrane protein
MFSYLMTAFTALLFVVLTPGVLLTLPSKASSNLTIVLVHGVIFALVYHLLHKTVKGLIQKYEGFDDDDDDDPIEGFDDDDDDGDLMEGFDDDDDDGDLMEGFDDDDDDNDPMVMEGFKTKKMSPRQRKARKALRHARAKSRAVVRASKKANRCAAAQARAAAACR